MKIAIPENTRFTCSQCGDCCRHYSVVLGPGESERIEGLDWEGREERLVSEQVVVAAEGRALKGRKRLAHRPDGDCVFLGERNQCLIHKHFGGEVKPLICRMYPFAFHRVGERVGVDVSFACNAISRGEGEAVTPEKLPDWMRTVFERIPAGKPRHELRPGVKLPPELVWEFEFFLVSFLTDRSLAFADRVRACMQFLKLTGGGDPTAKSGRIFREAIAQGIPNQLAMLPREERMDKTQRAAFYTLLFLLLQKSAASDMGLTAPDRERAQQEMLGHGERFRENTGRPLVDDRELEADFETIAAVDASFFEKKEQPLLERLFPAKITGKRYLIRPAREMPLVPAARELMLLYPMAVWTAKALAADRGAKAVEADDVRRAARLLDRRFGTLDLNEMNKEQIEAFEFLFAETDFVNAAVNEIMGLRKTGVISES